MGGTESSERKAVFGTASGDSNNHGYYNKGNVGGNFNMSGTNPNGNGANNGNNGGAGGGGPTNVNKTNNSG